MASSDETDHPVPQSNAVTTGALTYTSSSAPPAFFLGRLIETEWFCKIGVDGLLGFIFSIMTVSKNILFADDLGPEDLTPAKVVEMLDRYIVGQTEAKRAVAVALRMRSPALLLPLV